MHARTHIVTRITRSVREYGLPHLRRLRQCGPRSRDVGITRQFRMSATWIPTLRRRRRGAHGYFSCAVAGLFLRTRVISVHGTRPRYVVAPAATTGILLCPQMSHRSRIILFLAVVVHRIGGLVLPLCARASNTQLETSATPPSARTIIDERQCHMHNYRKPEPLSHLSLSLSLSLSNMVRPRS